MKHLAGKADDMQSIYNATVRRMKSLGVYKAEYDGVVFIYAQLCEQYLILTEKFKETEYQFQINTGAGGLKKSPMVATLENLRKDILSYTDRLCLNPKAFESVDISPPAQKSKLEQMLDGG